MSYRLDRRGRDHGWVGRPPSVETLAAAEMTVLKRNNGLGNKLDPKEEEREKVEFGAEL